MDLSGENKPMLKEYCFDKFIINVHLNFILLCGIMNWVIIFFLNEIEKKRDFTYDILDIMFVNAENLDEINIYIGLVEVPNLSKNIVHIFLRITKSL
ncbi:hypothetical protein KUTeg_004268 [Tegillarca granosa]|uniref:Uncharacterized protein n=1 Tax=Tegillarca granosa TaxID=220873 RepID=A0ABQ9FPG2_TEGGR|nr:hypothetical protein KUTeg_004268 [Tegillarca granosa]